MGPELEGEHRYTVVPAISGLAGETDRIWGMKVTTPTADADKAFTMHLTQSGNWSITSGNHRQMPNHHVYIYDGGVVTNAYKHDYATAACLIGSAACPLANMTGYFGTF